MWKSNPTAIVAVVGVGNELMGDDAAGVLIVQGMITRLPVDSLIHIVVGGPAPENCTGVLRRLKPGLVIFVDAGNFGAEPGSIGVFRSEESEGVSAFGHALPLHVLGKYLASEIGCESLLLLIQPERVVYDGEVTARVMEAVNEVVDELVSS